MARTNAPVIAGRAGDRLTRGLQRLIDRYGLPYVAYNQGSIVHLECSGVMLLDMRSPLKLLKENKPRKHLMEQMGAAYAAHGIITLAGSRHVHLDGRHRRGHRRRARPASTRSSPRWRGSDMSDDRRRSQAPVGLHRRSSPSTSAPRA